MKSRVPTLNPGSSSRALAGWAYQGVIFGFALAACAHPALSQRPAGVHPPVEVYVMKGAQLVRKQGGEAIPAPFADGWFCLKPEAMKALLDELTQPVGSTETDSSPASP